MSLVPVGNTNRYQRGCHLTSLVLVGNINRYQWKSKTPVEKSGVLSRGQWSRLRGTGWETGAFGLSQPVHKVRFLVVDGIGILRAVRSLKSSSYDRYVGTTNSKVIGS